jgi:hypothetical protein
MFVVRYAALLTLVIWICVLLRDTDWIHGNPHVTALACGGVLIASLLVLKFVGPPPRSFFLRAAIVGVMLALAGARWRVAWSAVPAIELALGCILLGWYAREP